MNFKATTTIGAHPHQLKTVDAIRDFLLAGNARFTLVSKRTGCRFTYRIRKPYEARPVHFVQVLTGSDNESNYTYLGTIFEGDRYQHGVRSKVRWEVPSARAFHWFWHLVQMNRLPNSLEVWHEGRCGRCGRALTVPASIEAGIGPECAGYVFENKQLKLGA